MKELRYMFWGGSDMFAAISRLPHASASAEHLQDVLGKLFEGLGKPMSNEELTRIVDEADVDHDARLRKDSYGEKTWCMIDMVD